LECIFKVANARVASALTDRTQRTIIIAANFYDDPDAIVSYAKGLEYVCPYNTPEGRDSGEFVSWHASRWRPARKCPFKSSEALIERLEYLTGERLDREHWNRRFPVDNHGYPVPGCESMRRSAWWNCTFHSKHYSKQKLGEGVHSHTNRDGWNAVGKNGWAGLIYLDKHTPRQTGLRTWENRDGKHRFDWMTPPTNWILCDTLANIYNRLILHRGGIPHSGAAGWGDSIENGRFFQTLFFRTSPEPPMRGVTVDFDNG
jgi:hypothetical protein